ncbi:hypothetical protein, partial [Aeromonas sobria]|uniref:hypothetical protein n=1 Tax=Aeromonas sobria TaxID=646 RepID=UPI0019D5C55E
MAGDTSLAGALDLTREFREKKKAVLSAPPNARKEKKPCGLKTKIWKQTIDFSTRKGLEFDTFRLCAMFYAALMYRIFS